MKLFEGKTKREKILIIGLVVAVVFSGYLFIRVKPVFEELSRTESRIKDEKKKYNSLLQQTSDTRPSSIIKKEIASLEKKLKKEKQNLTALDISFVDLGDQEALHTLISDITLSAERNQLTIISKINEMSELTRLVGSSEIDRINNLKNKSKSKNKKNKNTQTNLNNVVEKNSNLKRHLFKLQLRGTFSSTYQFIQSLNELEHGVLIARIKLQADDKNTYNGRRLITTDLTLAI